MDEVALSANIAKQEKFMRNTLIIGIVSAVALAVICGGGASLFIFVGASLGIAFSATILASKIATVATIAVLSVLPFIVAMTITLTALLVLGIKRHKNKKLLKEAEKKPDEPESGEKDESEKVNHSSNMNIFT